MSTIKPKKPRKKKCKQCREWFQPTRPIQPCCGFKCEIAYATEHAKKKADDRELQERKRIKKEASEARKAKREYIDNDRSHQTKLTQKTFNAWVLVRDDGKPCSSCGRSTGCKMNAGHFLSVGSTPELRFHPLNVHVQCEHCNSFKSGNIGEYRPMLIDKIGLDKVEWLEGPHEPKKYTCEQLREIRAYYARLTREGIKTDNDRPYK